MTLDYPSGSINATTSNPVKGRQRESDTEEKTT